MKRSLKIQQGIRENEDTIVIAIEEALDECEYPTSGRDKLEEAQFRNLVRVATSTDSAEVVKNFLRYQVGRDRKWGRGEQSLSERIIKDIDQILKDLSKAIFDSVKDIPEDDTSPNQKGIWMELIRRYLGYGSRYLKYLNSQREG